MVIEATVCHIINESRLLLQRKSTGKFGEGKWNGPGGKLEVGELPEIGAMREVFEETKLIVSELTYHGVLNFYFGKLQPVDWIVHIFSTTQFRGEPQSGEEGELHWFSFIEIPYSEMWEDDLYWLPLMMSGCRFRGDFWYSSENKLIDHSIEVLK